MTTSSIRVFLGTLAILPSFAAFAWAQSSDEMSMPKIELPAACNQGEMSVSNGQMQMPNMSTSTSPASMGYMKAMEAMHAPMMQGAMVPDADIAFNCAMIAHHLGAIEMAKVQLENGKDEQAKKMAQKTIDEQGKEVKEMTKWLEQHGKG